MFPECVTKVNIDTQKTATQSYAIILNGDFVTLYSVAYKINFIINLNFMK